MPENGLWQGVLFTDIDGTFKRWSMFLDVFYALVGKGILDDSVLQELSAVEEAWRRREGSFDQYVSKALDLYRAHLPGMSERQFNETMIEVVDQSYNKVYAFTRELIRRKQAAGWYICAISASPIVGVRRFCEHWGINDCIGTTSKVANGIFLGDRQVADGQAKYEFMRQVLDRPEFSDLPASKVWAIGDSEGDIQMLENAGVGIMFNPSSGLLSHRLSLGDSVFGPMVIERKDVVVELWSHWSLIHRVNLDGSLATISGLTTGDSIDGILNF